VVLAGSTGTGKSAFVAALAAHRALTAPVLFATYELPPRLLIARIASQQLRRSWLHVARDHVPREDLDRVLPPGLGFLSFARRWTSSSVPSSSRASTSAGEDPRKFSRLRPRVHTTCTRAG
jgi:hypothetical protein